MVRFIATQFGDIQLIALETCYLHMQRNIADNPHGMKITNYFLIALVLIIDNK